MVVRIEDMKPMLMNVNGEEILLPNRFTFDIRPRCFKSDHSDGSSSSTFGELRRVLDPRILSGKMSSDWLSISHELPDDIQALLNTTRDPPGSDASSHEPESCRQEASPTSNRARNSKDSTGEPGPSETKSQDDEEVRFRNMINRLQKRLPTPSLAKPREPRIKLQPADPAILSAKLKDGAIFENTQLSRVTELHPERKGRSSDSGYASDSTPSCTIHYTTPDNSRDSHEPAVVTKPSLESQSATKKLNPAAAEFKVSTDSVHLPVPTPKKLSRGPLTSLLFNPASDAAVVGPVPSVDKQQAAQTEEQPGAGDDKLQKQEQSSPVKSGAKTKHRNVPQVPHTQQPLLPPNQHPSIPVPPNVNLMAGTHPSLNFQPQKPNAALPFIPAPWLGGLNMGNFGTFPPSTAPSMAVPPFNMPSPEMAATLGTGTFLPSIRPPIPPFAPSAIGGLGSMYPQAAVPGMPPVPPTIPPAGVGQAAQPGPKVDRPYFPVTTKPRVPDPIKQQQYEEYLEWRKANEPGYHIKCKIRQANRVVRQHQHQPEAPKLEEPGITLAWKAIAEKAKAVMGAVEARRAAERKSKQNSVALEFKAKVFEKVLADAGKKDDKEESENKNDKEDSEKKAEHNQVTEGISNAVTENKATSETAENVVENAAKKTEEVKEGVKA